MTATITDTTTLLKEAVTHRLELERRFVKAKDAIGKGKRQTFEFECKGIAHHVGRVYTPAIHALMDALSPDELQEQIDVAVKRLSAALNLEPWPENDEQYDKSNRVFDRIDNHLRVLLDVQKRNPAGAAMQRLAALEQTAGWGKP